MYPVRAISQVVRIALATLLCLGAANAQSSFGALTGSVTDPVGAAVPQVVIKATNIETGATAQTTTDETGLYNIFSLIPGSYKLEAQKAGFERTDVEHVTLSTSLTTSVNIVLRIGKVSDTITVSAQAPLLTPTTPTVATTVEQDIVTSLPYGERGTLGVALLVAGVQGNPFDSMGVDSENPGPYTGYVLPGASLGVGGAPPGRSIILVDGSDVTQTSFPRAGIQVSGDMVQETTVIVGGIPAQYGRTMGGAIVQSTRGGTNGLHGAASWRHNDLGFNAFPTGAVVKAQNHQQFFGGVVGGPILLPKLYNGKNRTFFYFGFEPSRLQTTVNQQGRVPLPSDLQGDFSNNYDFINTTILASQGAAAALAAPRTGGVYYQSAINADGFPTGPLYSSNSQYVAVPNNNLSAQLAKNPFAKYLLSNMPTPQNPGPYFTFFNQNGLWNNAGNNVSYIRGVNNTDNRFAARLDHNLSDKDRLFIRFTNVPLTSARFFGLPASFPGSLSPSDQSWANDSALNETHVISPSMVNELRLMYMRNRQIRGENVAATSKDWGASFGLTPAINGAGFPQVAFGPAVFNGPAFGTTGLLADVDENYQFSDDVTWTHRNHTIRFGADIRRLQSNQLNLGGLYGGAYSFNNTQTNNGSTGGTGYASLILGLIGGYTNTPVEVPNYYRYHYYAGFVQDDVKISPTLTLNLGVRYEVETPRIDKLNYQGTFIPSLTGTLNGLPATGAFCFSGSCGLPTSLWPTNHLGFEPRLGVAWAPTNKMTVRAAFNLLRIPLTGYGNTANPNSQSARRLHHESGGTVGLRPLHGEGRWAVLLHGEQLLPDLRPAERCHALRHAVGLDRAIPTQPPDHAASRLPGTSRSASHHQPLTQPEQPQLGQHPEPHRLGHQRHHPEHPQPLPPHQFRQYRHQQRVCLSGPAAVPEFLQLGQRGDSGHPRVLQSRRRFHL
ncbi:MAG: TonB-dependent receptor [Candidatus Solibacter sp.]